MPSPLRIIFMGTPDFAANVLRRVIEGPHKVVAAYSQPPRPRGRGQELQKSPVHELAEAHDIPVLTPPHFKNEKDVEDFRSHEADIAIVAAYGMLLPQAILDAPQHGCINIHPSLLPRWRGTSPVQFTIWSGDAKAGVTIMKLVKEMDAGPIIVQQKMETAPQITYTELSHKLWKMGEDMLVGVLDRLAAKDHLDTTPQPAEGVTFTRMLTKEDGKIDWACTAKEIEHQVCALNPWPGTWTTTADGKRLKILEAITGDQAPGKNPGEILDAGAHVSCNHSTLRLISIQPENKKPMDIKAAFNGGYLKIGDILT